MDPVTISLIVVFSIVSPILACCSRQYIISNFPKSSVHKSSSHTSLADLNSEESDPA